MSSTRLTITLDVENSKLLSGVAQSDATTTKFARNFILNMEQAQQKVRQFADRSTQYLKNIENAANNLNTSVSKERFWNIINRVQYPTAKIIGYANSHTELSNKLKLVVNAENEHARAMATVYDISLKTAQSTQAISSVYQTFAQNSEQLKISQSEVAKLTETVAKSVAVSGASSAAASNALVQFSQSLLMGKMKAQEFNSLMTQTPSLVQAIAKGLGITTAELKAMVDKGEMSAEKMIDGLKKAESYVNGQYAKTTTTISGAMQNLSTSTEKMLGEMDKVMGISSLASNGINELAQNIDKLAPIALYAGTAFAGMKLQELTAQTWQLVSAKNQEFKVSVDQARAAVITATARQREIAEELKLTQSYIANLQAQMNLARTEQQRLLIGRELESQTTRETALITAHTAATKALATAQQQANAAKRMGVGLLNALGGPWGIAMGVISAGAIALFDWSQKANQAREEALRYADSLDSVRANIEKMTKAQTDAEMVKLSRSIREQESALADLKQRQAELTREIEQGATVLDDAFGAGVRLEKNAKDLAKAQEELKLVTADVEKAQNTLNASLEAQEALQAHVPIANLREEFVKLYPHIDESQIKVDGLNLAIGNFTVKSPEMVIAANNIASALGGVAGEAMRAAVMVANLSGMGLNIGANAVIDPKHLETIEQIERNNAIGSAKGKDKIALQVKDAMIKSGLKEGDAGYERLKAAYEQQFTLQNASKGSGKPKKTKAEKEAEKAAKKQQRDAERSAESYQNQVAEMTNRLSDLKTDKEDLVKYGGISQYQEVRKLTEDIALNAEKYKNYGTEGVAKLKELAAKIDSEQQLLAIEQFQVDHDKKLKSMQFELDLLGKTRTEKELLQFSNQLDLETERLKINMTKENIALLDEKIAKIKEEYKLHQKKQEETRTSAMMGIKEGWNNIEADVSNVAANVANITQNTFDGMADNLNNFIMTGKADFRGFAQSVLSDISKMLIKMALFNAIKQGMNLMGFSDGGLVGGSFAVGGYTGDGGKYTPAGIVHKGEYVITKEATSRLGLDYLNYLNYGRRGFASGGGVAVPRVPLSSYQPKSAQSSINVQVINNGEPVDAKVSQKQQGEQTQITVELMRKIARQEANGMIQNNFRAGGVFA